MKYLRSILLSVALLAPTLSSAAGYGPWHFGMTKPEVRAVVDGAPYYDFRNGDIGSQNGKFEGKQAPISFYFRNDRLVRVMVVAYAGQDYDEMKRAWLQVYSYIQRDFGGVEVPAKGRGPAEARLAEQALDESGLKDGENTKVQIGAAPMPADRRVWSTVDIVPTVGYWVAVNYAEP